MDVSTLNKYLYLLIIMHYGPRCILTSLQGPPNWTSDVAMSRSVCLDILLNCNKPAVNIMIDSLQLDGQRLLAHLLDISFLLQLSQIL